MLQNIDSIYEITSRADKYDARSAAGDMVTFRTLIVMHQILLAGIVVVQRLTAPYKSVLETETLVLTLISEIPTIVAVALTLVFAISAAGLLLFRAWGRRLFLSCFVAGLLLTVVNAFRPGAEWTLMISYLAGLTGILILMSAYFSALSRLFGILKPGHETK